MKEDDLLLRKMSYACQYETPETFNFCFVQKAPQVALSQHSSCQKMRAIYYKSGRELACLYSIYWSQSYSYE